MAAKERKVRIEIAPDPSTLYPGAKVTVSLKILEKDGTAWKDLPRTTTKSKTVTLSCAGFKGGSVAISFRRSESKTVELESLKAPYDFAPAIAFACSDGSKPAGIKFARRDGSKSSGRSLDIEIGTCSATFGLRTPNS